MSRDRRTTGHRPGATATISLPGLRAAGATSPRGLAGLAIGAVLAVALVVAVTLGATRSPSVPVPLPTFAEGAASSDPERPAGAPVLPGYPDAPSTGAQVPVGGAPVARDTDTVAGAVVQAVAAVIGSPYGRSVLDAVTDPPPAAAAAPTADVAPDADPALPAPPPVAPDTPPSPAPADPVPVTPPSGNGGESDGSGHRGGDDGDGSGHGGRG